MLNATFALLYGRLAFLHETAGRLVLGESWHGRRRALLIHLPADGPILDLGCGEGRLLMEIAQTEREAIGIDPSAAATERARRCRVPICRARAQALPFRDGVFAAVVCTYPGPWILDPCVWHEIERVTRVGGVIVVLLGGDYRRGPFAAPRRMLTRLAYGRRQSADGPVASPLPKNSRLCGSFDPTEDRWGTALVWSGVRSESALAC
jgi:SAM-dependent methyltransferase